MLINASVWHVHGCCMLPSANDYTSRLQDAISVRVAIKRSY